MREYGFSLTRILPYSYVFYVVTKTPAWLRLSIQGSNLVFLLLLYFPYGKTSRSQGILQASLQCFLFFLFPLFHSSSFKQYLLQFICWFYGIFIEEMGKNSGILWGISLLYRQYSILRTFPSNLPCSSLSLRILLQFNLVLTKGHTY